MFSSRLSCIWDYLTPELLCSVVLPMTMNECVPPHAPFTSCSSHGCVGLFAMCLLLGGGDVCAACLPAWSRAPRTALACALGCVLFHLTEFICIVPSWQALTLLWYRLVQLLGKMPCVPNINMSSRFLFLSFYLLFALTDTVWSWHYFSLEIFFFLVVFLLSNKLLNPAGGWNKSSGFYQPASSWCFATYRTNSSAHFDPKRA